MDNKEFKEILEENYVCVRTNDRFKTTFFDLPIIEQGIDKNAYYTNEIVKSDHIRLLLYVNEGSHAHEGTKIIYNKIMAIMRDKKLEEILK